MANRKKHYARYTYIQAFETLWRGDPTNPGAPFRTIALVTDQFNSTVGVLQVYALEGIGKGIENGGFAGTDGEPRLLFDRDFKGMDAAMGQFKELVNQAVTEEFKVLSIWDQIEFEEKLKVSKLR